MAKKKVDILKLTTAEWVQFVEQARRDHSHTPEELVKLRERREAHLRQQRHDKLKAEREALDERQRTAKRDALEAELKARYLRLGGKPEDWNGVKDDIVDKAIEAAVLSGKIKPEDPIGVARRVW